MVDPPVEKPKQPPVPSWRQYAGMGTEFAGGICGLTLLGYWIDHHYKTGTKATLICAGFGMVGGMYNFIRQAMALSKDTDAEAHQSHDSRRGETGRDDREIR